MRALVCVLVLASLLVPGAVASDGGSVADGECNETVELNCGIGAGFCHIYVRVGKLCLVFTAAELASA